MKRDLVRKGETLFGVVTERNRALERIATLEAALRGALPYVMQACGEGYLSDHPEKVGLVRQIRAALEAK